MSRSIFERGRLTVLAVALALVLVGCNTNDGTDDSPSTQPGNAESGPSETLSAIRDRGVVRIGLGSSRAPFRIDPSSDSPSGFEPALATAVAAALAPDAAVEFIRIPGETERAEALIVGDIDMALSLTVRDTTRIELFSSPYLINGAAVLVAANSDITSIADLEGTAVAARDGRADSALIEALLVAGNDITVLTLPTLADLTDAITTGQVGAALMSWPDAVIQAGVPGVDFAVVPVDMTFGPIAIATAQNKAFQGEVTAALEQIIANGTWLAVFEEWIGAPPWSVDQMADLAPS